MTIKSIYSDTAGSQNRNVNVAAALLLAVQTIPNLICINQKFMESGHSEMECDSVHSLIESRGNRVKVYTPEQWYQVPRTAKISKPAYSVSEMSFSDFKDFHSLSQALHSKSCKDRIWGGC